MSVRSESRTLHFDMRHCPPGVPITVYARGKEYPLKAHTTHTLRAHANEHPALKLISQDRRVELTHFCPKIDLAADAVGMIWAGYPSSDPNALLPELAAVAVHVPIAARRQALRRRIKSGTELRVPAPLLRHGVDAIGSAQLEDAILSASSLLGPLSVAQTILASHPEVSSLNPMIAATVLDHYIDMVLRRDSTLVAYISTHPPGADGWYKQTIVEDHTGKPMRPADDLVDSKGQTVVWPTKDGEPVIAQFQLSDGVLNAAESAVRLLLRLVKDAPELKGQLWTTEHGTTIVRETHVPPQTERPVRAGAGSFKWSSATRTSMYALDFDNGDVRFDPATSKLSIDIKNRANRSLGAYVEFLDQTGNTFSPPKWNSNLPLVLQIPLETDKQKYLQFISPTNVVFGIPAWQNWLTVTCSMPDEAATARILFGGLGISNRRDPVNLVGIIGTSVLNYGIPSMMIALSIGMQSTKWYMDLFDDPEVVEALMVLGIPLFTVAVGVAAIEFDTRAVLMKASNFVAGIVFSAGMKALARRVVEFTTTQELMQNCPLAGWALRVASVANTLAGMVATTAQVCLSPATYEIEISRAVDVSVTVMPDPAHGGPGGQKPIWPQVADHWDVQIRFNGGAYPAQGGPMPAPEAPLKLLFPNIPAGPGSSIQVVASVYSAHGWLAGRWASDWIATKPTSGTTVAIQGSIIESLVPLTADTVYSHKQMLQWRADQQKHTWVAAASAPAATITARKCANEGHGICQWLGMTMNNDAYALGYAYQAAGQNLPADDPDSPVVSSQLFAFQSISVLADPEAGMKTPEIGFTRQPFLAYDQFGPQPLLTLDSTFQSGLDRKSIGDALRQRFAAATPSYALPSGATVAATSRGAAWQIKSRGSVLYNLSISRDPSSGASVIEVYGNPPTAFLFSMDAGHTEHLDAGTIPAAVVTIFANAAPNYTLPANAAIEVKTPSLNWTIGVPGQPPRFELRRSTDTIGVFLYPAPSFSRRNFYLDPRSRGNDGTYWLRQVGLFDGSKTFDYSTGQSWGRFVDVNMSAMVVHPNGYVIGVDYANHKMQILKLPDTAVKDSLAAVATLASGKGIREGLMMGPVAMTVTPDGRLLVLEQDNQRLQAFDIVGNPVQCFKGDLRFTLDRSHIAALDSRSPTVALVQAYQRAVAPAVSGLLQLPAAAAADLDASTVPADLIEAFSHAGIRLKEATISIVVTTTGSLWLLRDADTGLSYEIRANDEEGALDVFNAPDLSVRVVGRGAEWLLLDRTSTMTFAVHAGTDGKPIDAVQQVATAALRDSGGARVTYLDVAVEAKSFIYVLSYANKGASPSDYRLDIYNPDGTWLARTPPVGSQTGVNAARMSVDQWRNLYTLDFASFLGPQNRTEPAVSMWTPSVPIVRGER